MTKKDYIAIAEALQTIKPRTYLLFVTARNLATYFEKDNPRFDREKFLKACGF